MADVKHLDIGGIWIDCTVREVHSLRATATQHPVESGAPITDHVRPQPDSLQIEGVVTNTPIQQPGSHAPDNLFADITTPLDIRQGGSTPGTLTFEGEPVWGWMQYGSFAAGIYSSVRNSPLVPRRELTARWERNTNEARQLGMHALAAAGAPWDRVKAVQNDLRALMQTGESVTVTTGVQVYTPCVMVDLQIHRDAQTGSALVFSATLQVIRIVQTQSGKPIPQDVRATPAQSKGTQNVVPTKPGEIPPAVPAQADSILKTIGRPPPEPGQ